ncbi:hypothetical protein [Streptomyces caniferus]|uniref:hypothetical protein n=1 Tax=Streptomyces caniferus TaxID=285557 RepID=UPI00381796BF
MSHTLRHARKAAAAMVITVAALGLTACQGSGADASSPSTSAHATQSPTSAAKTTRNSAKDAPKGAAEKPGTSCTNQINYAGDPRSNAEINSIGEKTGHCPPVRHQ